MSVRVKICGITRPEDAQAAVAAGADALGFMFWPESARRISIAAAAAICRGLPPLVSKVGVFVNAAPADVRRAVAACRLDAVQFHGDETPGFCARFVVPVIRAFRVSGPETLDRLGDYAVAAWLLDSHVAGQRGGRIRATGRVRFKTVTSSPCATQARMALNSWRTCRMVAVFMWHNM